MRSAALEERPDGLEERGENKFKIQCLRFKIKSKTKKQGGNMEEEKQVVFCLHKDCIFFVYKKKGESMCGLKDPRINHNVQKGCLDYQGKGGDGDGK